jgi:hypothetical protein
VTSEAPTEAAAAAVPVTRRSPMQPVAVVATAAAAALLVRLALLPLLSGAEAQSPPLTWPGLASAAARLAGIPLPAPFGWWRVVAWRSAPGRDEAASIRPECQRGAWAAREAEDPAVPAKLLREALSALGAKRPPTACVLASPRLSSLQALVATSSQALPSLVEVEPLQVQATVARSSRPSAARSWWPRQPSC